MPIPKLPYHPSAFRRMVGVLGDGTGFRPDPWQEADFRAVDDAWLRLGGYPHDESAPRRVWIERPRGHSKTSDLALQSLWALYHGKRPLVGIAVAADSDQARLLLEACERLVRNNDWLAKTLTGGDALEIQRDRVVAHHTGSVLKVMSSDVGSSYGLLPDFVIADEITHWPDKAEQLWHSLFSSAAKKRHTLLLCILNAGSMETWSGRLRESIRHDSSWCFRRLDRPTASWLSPESLDEQRRLLPSAVYERLWNNVWQSGSGSIFTREDLTPLVTLTGEQLERRQGWQTFAGLDLGVSRDASALVVIGRHVGYSKEIPAPERVIPSSTVRAMVDMGFVDAPPRESTYETVAPTNRLEVQCVRIWKPSNGSKLDLSAIETELLALHRRLGFRLVIDAWQAELLSQRLRQAGVIVRPVQATPSILQEQASLIQDGIREQTLSMFHHPDLETDIVRLKLEDRGHSYRLTSPRVSADAGGTRHGDAASALMLSLYATRLFPQTFCTNRQLVYN